MRLAAYPRSLGRKVGRKVRSVLPSRRRCLLVAATTAVMLTIAAVLDSHLTHTAGAGIGLFQEYDGRQQPATPEVHASAWRGGEDHAAVAVTQVVTCCGEQRAHRLRETCAQQPRAPATNITFPVTSSSKHNIMFCPMCKVASTFWTRFFKMLDHYDDVGVRTPYDIPIRRAPPTRERLTVSTSGTLTPNFTDAYKFVFVRNPYSRLLSAYIDKLLAPNPMFWRGLSSRIVRRYRRRQQGPSLDSDGEVQRCGSDLTFRELVQAIVDWQREGAALDCHIGHLHSTCHLCRVPYDFVGHLETLNGDSLSLYRKLGLNKTLQLAHEMQTLADEDALNDTVTSAFNFKSEVVKCVTWQNGLRRVWRKLQVRGVIGRDEFPLRAREAERITATEMLALVRATQARTPYSERKAQRQHAMVEIYRTVPIDLLHDLRRVYAADLTLLGYDSYPASLFDRNSTISDFGYLTV